LKQLSVGNLYHINVFKVILLKLRNNDARKLN